MSLQLTEPLFDDQTSFQNADRGYIATLEPCIIKDKNGREVWNNEEYAFLNGPCPSTVNPKLWRQGQLTLKHGLFEVMTGLYQVRGFDISNMTLIEGESGVIVLDVLQSTECAAKALDIYRLHRGNRSVKAVVYSHCHYDHFSGALGVLSDASTGIGDTPIIAPAGFIEEVLKEKVAVGPAMLNRAVSMFGESLPKSPRGHVGCGLGMASSSGTRSLVPPNDIINSTGEERTIDGVRLVFQMVPDTEAPSEFNVFLPDCRALCIAECATNTMHNIATLRGAAVRDAKRWSKHLDETIVLYGSDSDVLFSSHHWPTWGQEELISFISDQRDLYGYMHDQTVRLMNTGLTGTEIAEQLRLPPGLQSKWHAREYYGALNQNVKGVYQRYMTWFDGNAANIWKHPPLEDAIRYVHCMGGTAAVMQKAQEYMDQDDLRFAATLLDHVVAAESQNGQARDQLAQVYETLAYGAENAVWRNYYLTAAQTLRRLPGLETGSGKRIGGLSSISPHSSVEDWFDALSLRLDGPEAGALSRQIVIAIQIPEAHVRWTLRLRNGTLTYRCQDSESNAAYQQSESIDLAISLSKLEVYELLSRGALDVIRNNYEGDIDSAITLLGLCDIV